MRGKLSQSAIAKATGIGQKTISALETGASQGIEFGTLAKLCTYLKCTPGDLLVLEDKLEYKAPSKAALEKANEIIASGLKAAMASPEESAEKIWAKFDQVRLKLQRSANLSKEQGTLRKQKARA